MGSDLTIDNVPGPVFEGEDQQFWISGVGPAASQMWAVRPDPMFQRDSDLLILRPNSCPEIALLLFFVPVGNGDTDRGAHHAGDSNHTLHTESLSQQQGSDQGSDNGFYADDNTVSPVGESFQRRKLEGEGQGR